MLLHFSSTQCSYCYSSTTTAIIPKSFHLVMILYHSTPSLFYLYLQVDKISLFYLYFLPPLLYSSPAVCLCLSSQIQVQSARADHGKGHVSIKRKGAYSSQSIKYCHFKPPLCFPRKPMQLVLAGLMLSWTSRQIQFMTSPQY